MCAYIVSLMRIASGLLPEYVYAHLLTCRELRRRSLARAQSVPPCVLKSRIPCASTLPYPGPSSSTAARLIIIIETAFAACYGVNEAKADICSSKTDIF